MYTSVWFLFIIPFLGFYGSEKFNGSISDFIIINQKYFILEFVFVCVALYVLWWGLQQPPKVKIGKLGIGIAINAESDEEKRRLKNDFIAEIKKQVSLENSQLFQILVMPDFFTEKINDRDSAIKYQRMTRSHFFIYGNWKTRQDEGNEVYVLNLEASVVHSPIDLSTSNSFSKEMSAIFPRDVKIQKELELTEIPLTGDMVSLAAKHCIGIASLISGNAELAFKLHYGLWKQIGEISNVKSTFFYCISLMKQNLPKYLFQESTILSNFYYESSIPNRLEKIKEYLDVIFLFYPNEYSGLVRQGIYFFEKGEIEEAIKTTKKAVSCSGNRDITAQYNFAFLMAFVGRLEEAHKAYKYAFAGTVKDPEFILSIEEFIDNLLQKHPEKFQFNYCLGMINFFGKEDYQLAKENFETFIKMAKESKKFNPSVKYAQEYLKKTNQIIDSRQSV